jgi:hypothetical protein
MNTGSAKRHAGFIRIHVPSGAGSPTASADLWIEDLDTAIEVIASLSCAVEGLNVQVADLQRRLAEMELQMYELMHPGPDVF